MIKLRKIEKTCARFRTLETSASPLPEIGTEARLVAGGSGGYKQTVKEFDRDLIQKTLAENNQNVSRAASKLGLSRYGLIKKLKRYGIKAAG